MPEPPAFPLSLTLSHCLCRAGDVSMAVELNGSRVTSSIPQLIGAISRTCFTDKRLRHTATRPYMARWLGI